MAAVFYDQNQEENDLHHRAQCRIYKHSKDPWKLARELSSSKIKEGGGWEHGHGIENEDDQMATSVTSVSQSEMLTPGKHAD